MKTTGFDLRRTYSGDWELVCLLTKDSIQEAMRLIDGAKGKTFELTVKVFRAKRTLQANAYFHTLCNKLATALGVDDDEMKTHLVLKYGKVAEIDGVPFTITIPKEGNITEYYRYARWIEGDECTDTYILYKQTHTLNSTEFARLIGGTVEDCRELGIETLPPDDLERMYAQADAIYGDTKER